MLPVQDTDICVVVTFFGQYFYSTVFLENNTGFIMANINDYFTPIEKDHRRRLGSFLVRGLLQFRLIYLFPF
ncbi:MAG: hypothetical protein U9P14_02935 [Gemmatimonadota bacterium]|nr:hypothetical protein [Gemmatimonadota bacterium]